MNSRMLAAMLTRAHLAIASLSCVLGFAAACTDSTKGLADQDEGEMGLDEGVEATAFFEIHDDASDLCSGADTVEIVTRRLDCWDPPVPCTLAQDPPDVLGTSRACDEVAGTQLWDLGVTQTGQWQVELRALAGDEVVGGQCFGYQGMELVPVALADMNSGVTFELERLGSGPCS